MPLYGYQCRNCGHTLEELQTISEAPLEECPKCGQKTLARTIGSGSGLIFKGTGFYLTDYKKTNSTTAPSKPKKDAAASPNPTPSPTKDSKPPTSKKE
jgi:putative FmdB family regulatory protein